MATGSGVAVNGGRGYVKERMSTPVRNWRLAMTGQVRGICLYLPTQPLMACPGSCPYVDAGAVNLRGIPTTPRTVIVMSIAGADRAQHANDEETRGAPVNTPAPDPVVREVDVR